MTTIAEGLAEYVLGTDVGALPANVVEKSEQVILDTIGCTLAGSRDRVGTSATAYAAGRGSAGRSTVFGRRERVDPEHAALANGTAAHVLEMDDGHRPSDNHLGGVVVPAALAVGQAAGSTGPEIVAAVAVGYDVMGRVGEAVMLPRIRSPFHHTGTTGVFGSAAVTGRLLGFDAARLVNAFGVAGDGAAALKEFQTPPFTGMDCKPLHSGRAAQTGITSAFLAADGLEGSTTIFEGPKGFVRTFSPQPRPELILRDLGQRFALIESGFKLHACPGGALAIAVDAALHLRREHAIDTDSVRAIRLGLPTWTADPGFERLRHRRPTTVGSARFSYPFAVAVALQEGEVTHHQMQGDRLSDPRILRLQDLIEFVDDREVNEISDRLTREDPYYYAPASIEVETDGHTYRRLERTPRGYDPLRALTRDEVIAKFRFMVRDILSDAQADRLVAWTFALHAGAPIDGLAAALA
jgi:2-methylcitrate dehydratase PrpD